MERCIEDARSLCAALGYDMNTVELAIRDGVPYAIDFMNSAPDFDITSLGPEHFKWTVEKMADLVIKRTLSSGGAKLPAAVFEGRALDTLASFRKEPA